MKSKILVTGVGSGLGKFLYEKMSLNSIFEVSGLTRDNYDSIIDKSFDTIIHCAFNKEDVVTDYKKYLNDNIILTQKLKQIPCTKFIYLSTVDVYETPVRRTYSLFKLLAETLLDKKDLILRCPTMLGSTTKENHITRLFSNVPKIGLSPLSEVNYILMSDLLDFFTSEDYIKYEGIIDFVSNGDVKLSTVKSYFNSNTELGDYVYKRKFLNPIYLLDKKYNKSSLDKIKQYYG